MSDFSPETMRARFYQLKAQVAAIEAEAKPLRDEYDKLSQDSAARLKALADRFKPIEAPLFGMKNELGMLARALGGKTGKPPEA
jgi:hypothetical protein